jgi:AcrR family transcriptional regulator
VPLAWGWVAMMSGRDNSPRPQRNDGVASSSRPSARRRRGRGEGSVTLLPDGRWQARVSWTEPSGRRRRKAVYGRTRQEAQQKLRQLLAARDQGRPLPSDDRLTLGAFLTRWLEDVAARKVRPTTLRRYSLDVARITAALGRVRLSRLSSADVQRFVNNLSDQGLAPATVRHCRATLRAALNQAVAWGLIPDNPAGGKKVATPAVPKAPVPAMTPELAEAILAAVQGTAVEGPVTVALLTGLRLGECLGLTWMDVVLDASPPTLTVRHQLQRLGGRWRLTPPKGGGWPSCGCAPAPSGSPCPGRATTPAWTTSCFPARPAGRRTRATSPRRSSARWPVPAFLACAFTICATAPPLCWWRPAPRCAPWPTCWATPASP